MARAVNTNSLNFLSGREGFNTSLRFFKTALGFSNDISEGYNLADILNEALENKEINSYQIKNLLSLLLADKFGYASKSQNLTQEIGNIDKIVAIVEKWKLIHLVVVYYESDGNITLLNGSEKEQWEKILPLSKDEFLVCYAGSPEDIKFSTLESAAEDFFKLINGEKVKSKGEYGTGASSSPKLRLEHEPEPEPEAEAEVAKTETPVNTKNMSARLGVTVTNELFHNGNVEAWKKIIESYKLSHPGLDVLIWYEGERIYDINALFKWGKVKSGCPIMFSVVGENIRNVAKLRKYLFEGASQRFEVFLKGPVGAVLKLF